MNAQLALFARYIPGHSAFHRVPAGVLLATTMALTFSGLFGQRWWLSAGLLVGLLVAVAATRIPARLGFPLPPVVWVMFGVLAGYHLLVTNWQTAVLVTTNFAICIYAARLVTLTQPTAELIDVLVAVVRPLRVLGLRPQRFALAVTLMVRSIPYLLGSFGEVRDAARARGIERRLWQQLVPVVVNAVYYAQATGEALAARGLGEED